MDLTPFLPIQTAAATLALQGTPRTQAGALWVPLRLTCRDDAGAVVAVQDQEVCLLSAAHQRLPPARLRAWLAAWAAVLPTILAEADAETLLPSDLILPELLDDPALQTEADFAAALADGGRWEAVWAARQLAELQARLDENLGAGSAQAQGIAALVRRPSVAIHIDEDSPADLPLGASRLGGQPDLTPDRVWPEIGGVRLSFLAQLDLAEVHAAAGAEAAALLPREGWLLFFFGLSGWGPVSSAKARGGGRVIHLQAPRAALVRRAPPPGVTELALRSVVLEAEPLPLPGLETPFYALLLPRLSPDGDPYAEAWTRFGFLGDEMQPSLAASADRPQDRLLGYADALQGDPYVQCALEAERIDLETAWDRAVLAKGAEWSLLLQADSDAEAGVSLGDMGVVQFFIRPADLAAGRFDRVRAVWQTT